MGIYNKSPFQWAGGKGKALHLLIPILEKYRSNSNTLVEPFVGAANVGLNIDFNKYVWNDLNKDLIDSYLHIFNDVNNYLHKCGELFNVGFEQYYELRDVFNNTNNEFERVCIFQYLNKFGFNGLCRYNKKGGFNVPIGTITKNPKRVPREQTLHLSEFKDKVKLMNDSFEEVFKKYEEEGNCLVYCDPPYVALNSDFKYTKEGFNLDDQVRLRDLAKESRHTVILSNHWTDYTKELYENATELITFDVQRTISCKGAERKKVQEVIAIYEK